jgi:hypothetical protein
MRLGTKWVLVPKSYSPPHLDRLPFKPIGPTRGEATAPAKASTRAPLVAQVGLGLLSFSNLVGYGLVNHPEVFVQDVRINMHWPTTSPVPIGSVLFYS